MDRNDLYSRNILTNFNGRQADPDTACSLRVEGFIIIYLSILLFILFIYLFIICYQPWDGTELLDWYRYVKVCVTLP